MLARRVWLRVRCPRLLGYCSLVYPLGALRCVCAVFWATWLVATGVPAQSVVSRVRCPGPPGSCSPVCSLIALCCVCGVLGYLAPDHRCARSVCCVACAVFSATWLLFTDVRARCVVLRVRCPGSLGSWSPVCPLGVLCCCRVSRTTWLLFTGVPARCVVLEVRCAGPLGSCSPVCSLSAFAPAGGRSCLVPVRVPCLLLAACLSGVPRAPRGAQHLVRSGRSRCSVRLSRRSGAFPHARGLRPRVYWAGARVTRRPAANRAQCARCWPLPRQGR